jgi:hypothetical protein
MKVKLTIPTELKEIKLKDYIRFMNVVKGSNDAEFINQKMVECFCGIDLKEVAKISLSDLDNLVEHFNKLFEQKTKFINRFTLNGIEFGFIPNLDKITNGEYMDIDSNISDVNNYHILMGIMYRPITNKFKNRYQIEPYEANEEYFELMKDLTLDVVLPALVFFYHLGTELLKVLPRFLEEEANKMNSQKNINSGKSGDGINAYIHSLKETLPDLMTLVEKNFLSH